MWDWMRGRPNGLYVRVAAEFREILVSGENGSQAEEANRFRGT
jgi:hypothetical protein